MPVVNFKYNYMVIYQKDFFNIERIEKRLTNGVLVVLYKQKGFYINCQAILRSGSRYDENKFPGINHLIEHIIFRNPKIISLIKKMEQSGVIFNVYTNKETIKIETSISDKSDFNIITDFYREIFTGILVDNKFLESEKKIINHEYNKNITNPINARINSIYHLFFKDTSLDHPVVGYENSLKSINNEDIVKQYEKIFDKSRLTFVISGDIDIDQIVEDFEKINFLDKNKFIPETYIDNKSLEDRIRWPATIKRNYIFYGTINKNYFNKKDTHIFLLKSILANGYNSKLFSKLRVEESLSYRVSPVSFGKFDVASGITTECFDEDLFNIIEQIRNVISDIFSNGINEKELFEEKNKIFKSLKIKTQHPLFFANANGFYDTLEINRGIDTIIKEIQETTIEEINEMIKIYFDLTKWKLISVGNVDIKNIKL